MMICAVKGLNGDYGAGGDGQGQRNVVVFSYADGGGSEEIAIEQGVVVAHADIKVMCAWMLKTRAGC